MSAPKTLPKPPPKAPPKGLPGALPGPAPAGISSASGKSPAAASAGPSSAPRKPPAAAQPAPAAQTARPAAAPPAPARPAIPGPAKPPAITGLAPSMAAMAEAIVMYDELLAEENAMLRNHDGRGVASLQDRKQAVTRLYQERLRVVQADGQALAVTDEQRGQLQELARRLDERAAENAVLLKAGIHAIERLFATINSAVRQHRDKEVAYSKAGVVTPQVSSAASIAYNRTI